VTFVGKELVIVMNFSCLFPGSIAGVQANRHKLNSSTKSQNAMKTAGQKNGEIGFQLNGSRDIVRTIKSDAASHEAVCYHRTETHGFKVANTNLSILREDNAIGGLHCRRDAPSSLRGRQANTA
jgi:hypothetical protein